MLIVIEGCDGVGKATQAKKLVERLQAAEHNVVLYSFPRYDTPLGKLIKRHLRNEVELRERYTVQLVTVSGDTRYTESRQRPAPEDPIMFQCLMVADKYDAAHDIEAQLNDGSIVVCDRWTPSALAYGAVDGLDTEWLASVQSRLPIPELHVLLSVPEQEQLQRLAARGKARGEDADRYEKNREKQLAVRAEYEKIWAAGAAHQGAETWVMVDGVGTVDEVHERICTHLQWVL